MTQDERKFGKKRKRKTKFGSEIVALDRMTQFLRVCARIVENHQYESISLEVGDWPNNPVMIDAQTANAVMTVWKNLKFPTRKKFVRALNQGGPLHIVELCWGAISNSRSTSKAA